MRVTFLESSAGLRLTKTITPTESKSYPDVKNVNSFEFQLPIDDDWHDEFAYMLSQHGAKGRCLLKGPLKKQLVNESRAGYSNKIEYSDLLVLDLDNLRLDQNVIGQVPLTKSNVKNIADEVLKHLGPDFINVSYVAQASSSLGRKHGKVSMHIFFALSIPLPPKTIKLWLKHINQSTALFKDQLELSSTGQSLKYPLDPSVADNSKLIFISPPDFTAAGLDPFAKPEERIVVVKRPKVTLDLATIVGAINPEKVFEEGIKVKEELREKSGLKKRQPKLATVNIAGENLEVITNPDKMSISIVNEEPPYVRCNINGGDSGAYYFNVNDPTYMFNFKDEPVFEIEKADRDFHAAVFEKYKNSSAAGPDGKAVRPIRPIVLRDFASDTLYNGLYDPNSGRFSEAFPLTPTSAGAIQGFMRSHGQAEPDYIPEAKVVFDPPNGTEKPNLDTVPYYVNLYHQTPIMDQAIEPETPLAYGDGSQVATHCPTIYTIAKHMCGDGQKEVDHFLNWLAFIYQKKTKTMTAWVFGGVPGTGKGVFVSRVLRPIFGEQHVTMKALENIEEQFNSFMRTAMFLVVDEFRMSDSKGGQGGSTRIADKLKNQITEPTVTIRSMRSNQLELPSFTNFIFLTNRQDAVKIEAGDRRYNVAPRQEKKLVDVYPEIVANLQNIEKELPAFAGILKTFKVDEQKARTCLANEAKENMKNVSMSVFDDFCAAFKNSSITPLIDVLGISVTDTFNAGRITAAQKYVKAWIADAKHGRSSLVQPEHLRHVFHVLNENQQPLAVRQFSKMLSRNGLTAVPHRVGSGTLRAIKIDWVEPPSQIDEYISTYFSQEDQVLLPKKSVA